MASTRKKYPNNQGIFGLKAKGRRSRAKLSFTEKLNLVDALRKRIQPIIRLRKSRKNSKTRRRGRT